MIIKKNNWLNKLEGCAAFILGNGPSLTDNNLSLLDKYFTIGINRIFLTYTPTVLLWQDIGLYEEHFHNIKETNSILYARQGSFSGSFNRDIYSWKLENNKNYTLINNNTNSYTGRGSTGLIAFKLAYSLGCNPIILVGMDCCYKDDKTDFYGVNKNHTPKTLIHCNQGLEAIKSITNKDTYSCSDNNVFPKIEFNNVIDILSNHAKGQDYYKSKLEI